MASMVETLLERIRADNEKTAARQSRADDEARLQISVDNQKRMKEADELSNKMFEFRNAVDNNGKKINDLRTSSAQLELKQMENQRQDLIEQIQQSKQLTDIKSDGVKDLELQRTNLDKLKEGIEAQGGVAMDNNEYRKLDLKQKLDALKLRKSQATNKGAQEEIEKERKKLIEDQGTTLQKISLGITGLGATLKEGAKAKIAGAGRGLMAILKGTLFAGLLLAVAAWLNSESFQNTITYIEKTIIPAIINFGKKIKEFYLAFFGEEGGFMNGIKTLFSDESGLGKIVLGLGAVGAGLATYKLATMFSDITGGISKLGGFLSDSGSKLKNLVFPSKGGGAGALPTRSGVSSTPQSGPARGGGQPGRVTRAAQGISKLGKAAGEGIGGFISGVLKGVASGLTAIANPAALIGLAAVSAAILAVSAAIRIMEPAFEPIGKMIESFGETIKTVFEGIGGFVENIGAGIGSVVESLGESIGNVVDKISAMSTAGTDATTKQIKELSSIPADKLFAAAGGIDAMKNALDDFGGGTFSKVADSLFGGSGPIDKLVDLAKNVTPLMKAAEAISVISAAGGDYAMAQAELKRRERVTELESQLASGDVEGRNTKENIAKAQAELDALKAQKMELQLSGNRAQGGPVKAGSMYLVNERGSEIFVPDQPGQMLSAERTAQMMRSGNMDRASNQSPVVISSPTVNTRTENVSNSSSNISYITNPDLIFQRTAGFAI